MMRVATHNNSDIQIHFAEFREEVSDMLQWSGEAAMIDGTRFFFANIKERLQADINYLSNNLRRGGLPVWGYEPYDDGVDTWAS